MIQLADTQFQCDACNGIFDKERSDAEAEIEAKTLWGDIAKSDLAVICDDCFERGKIAALYEHQSRHHGKNT